MILTDELWDMLEPATASFEGVKRRDVEEGLQSGQYHLFATERSAAVTAEFGAALRIGLAGGNLEDLLDIEVDICDFAKDRGYQAVEIIGRPGWERVLDGYERKAVLLRKEIGYGLH